MRADHFAADTVECVERREADCRNDLHPIADLLRRDPGRRLLVVLGGNRESLGACPTATTVGTLDLAAPARPTTRVRDDVTSCVGSLADAHGSIVIETGEVRLLRCSAR